MGLPDGESRLITLAFHVVTNKDANLAWISRARDSSKTRDAEAGARGNQRLAAAASYRNRNFAPGIHGTAKFERQIANVYAGRKEG
jgi:hypothetical protein